MKRVERTVPSRTIVRFLCEICGKKHRTESAALRCESKGCEVQKFNIGDDVRAFEKRQCNFGKTYRMQGKVIAVIGPQLVSGEETKWVKAREGWYDKHVFKYEVEYICPICHKKKTMLYFAPELKRSN